MNSVNTADIRYDRGTLVIDTKYVADYGRHKNVSREIVGDTITVKAERCRFGMSLSKGNFPVDEITEDSCELYRPWPWSTPRKRALNYVEYKKRESVVYTSNHYTIIS